MFARLSAEPYFHIASRCTCVVVSAAPPFVDRPRRTVIGRRMARTIDVIVLVTWLDRCELNSTKLDGRRGRQDVDGEFSFSLTSQLSHE